MFLFLSLSYYPFVQVATQKGQRASINGKWTIVMHSIMGPMYNRSESGASNCLHYVIQTSSPFVLYPATTARCTVSITSMQLPFPATERLRRAWEERTGNPREVTGEGRGRKGKRGKGKERKAKEDRTKE